MKPITRILFLASGFMLVAILSRCGGSQEKVPPLTINPTSLPNGTLGAPYSQTIQAGGGVAPFSWTGIGALPHNLQLIAGAGNVATISGMPDTTAQAVVFSVKVTDSANQSATQSYTVSILPEPDTLTLSPPSLNFPPQLIGMLSRAQAETVTNTGTSAVVISSVALTGTNAADFNQSNTCGSSLTAGANCTINVTVTPSQLGARSASITITDNTAGSPHSVSLSGVGLTSGPNATWSTTSLTFGNQVVNTTSPAQSITLSNYGTTTLNITSITATANFGETNTCGSLASGADCAISVTFMPSATGSVNGTLSIADNAPGSPQTVSLTGTGTSSQVKGWCEVNSLSHALTGTCITPEVGPIVQECFFQPASTSCPAGAPAIESHFKLCGYAVYTIDTARTCP